MNDKRKCIFTGQIANFSMKITSIESEKHNWAKSVPCTKEFYESLEGRPLNKYEFKLVELFYEQELSRLNIARLEEKINCVRNLANKRRMEDSLDELVGISEQLRVYKIDMEDVVEHADPLDIPMIEGIDSLNQEVEESEKYTIPTHIIDNAFPPEEQEVEEKEDDTIKKVVKKKKINLWE